MPVLFLTFWIVLNSRITIEIVVIGLVIAFLMTIFAYRLFRIGIKDELRMWHRFGLYLIVYPFRLFICLVKANLLMIKVVLSPKDNISPHIVYFNSPVSLTISKFLFMYSTSLTPGSIVFEMEENRFGIHCINEITVKDINDTKFVSGLKKIERGGNG